MNLIHQLQNLRCFAQDPLQFMRVMHNHKGDLFSLNFGYKKFHFVSHPDFVQQVLSNRVDHYQKSRLIFDKIKPITGEKGLVQLEGDEWQFMRHATNEIFHGKYEANNIAVINYYTDELMSKINAKIATNTAFDIGALMINYSMNIAMRIFLGLTQHKEIESVANNFIKLNYYCGLKMRQIFAMPYWVPTPLNLRIRQLQNHLKNTIANLINAASERSEMSLLKNLLSKLNGKNLKQLIHDQVMTFIFAGYETTSASLAFCFFYLAENPSFQQKIRDDKNAEYALAFYRETLRLNPPAYMLVREAIKDDYLGDIKIAKGDNIVLSINEVHRHKCSWPQANEFLPERFLKANKPKYPQHKFAFLPFGYGKRVCSGMQLAMLEANIVLHKLLKHFYFYFPESCRLQTEAMVTLHPKHPINLLAKTI